MATVASNCEKIPGSDNNDLDNDLEECYALNNLYYLFLHK